VDLAVPADLGVVTDAEEFRRWVTPHLDAMSRLAARLTSLADRDDVVQEALVRAWRRHATYDASRGSVQAWLLAIVADRSRRHRTRSPRPHRELVDRPADPTDLDRRVDVDRALAALSIRQRLAVELHYFVGLRTIDCAEVMDCSEGTVKSALSDARRRLRTVLEEQ
jgi:RNA polymerase sigma-70 factor (ECF subfamily)